MLKVILSFFSVNFFSEHWKPVVIEQTWWQFGIYEYVYNVPWILYCLNTPQHNFWSAKIEIKMIQLIKHNLSVAQEETPMHLILCDKFETLSAISVWV